MRISIIGLGLIGGSMAIDLRRRKFATHITGVDTSKLNAQAALNLGLVDELASLDQAIENADLIILAIPANVTMQLLPQILDKVDHQIVTDVGSVKGLVCEKIKSHSKRLNYVAAHPMAGTEHSGPWAAPSGLFDGKAVILCDCEASSKQAVDLVKSMYGVLNMHIVHMGSTDHDTHAAYVSHISHISSFALALTVLDKEQSEKNIFNLASGGFDSTVRLAKSSADMWSPIFEQNAENILPVLDTYIQQLQVFKKAIANKDNAQMVEMINKANRIKKILSA